MRVLSLFDGMSCGMIAMKNVGINVDRYVSYEIDKYAIKTSLYNFPNIEQFGDVFYADFSKYKDFDIIMGGSPCTFWSSAKNKNREITPDGTGGKLFEQYYRAVEESKPKFFVYENNKSMSNNIKEYISERFGFNPVCINSSLVSGQNRKRYYWVGRRKNNGKYDNIEISQPKDFYITLDDIVESGFGINTSKDNKSQTIKAQYSHTSVRNICCYHSTYGASGVAEPVCERINGGGCEYNNFINKYAAPCVWNSDNSIKKAISFVNRKIYDVYSVKNYNIIINDIPYPINLKDGLYIIRKFTVEECKRLQTIPDWYKFPVSDFQAYKMIGNGWTCDIIAHIIKSIFNI